MWPKLPKGLPLKLLWHTAPWPYILAGRSLHRPKLSQLKTIPLGFKHCPLQGVAQPPTHSKERRVGKSRYLFPGKRASMKVLKIQTYNRPRRAIETFFQANMLCYELSSPLKIFSVKFEQILLESTGMCCCLNLKTNNSTPQPGASPYHHSHVWRSCCRLSHVVHTHLLPLPDPEVRIPLNKLNTAQGTVF